MLNANTERKARNVLFRIVKIETFNAGTPAPRLIANNVSSTVGINFQYTTDEENDDVYAASHNST